MKRFVASRSSSQQELQPHDDVWVERPAIALSVGLIWPPARHPRLPGRTFQEAGKCALQQHILQHHELPHGAFLRRPDWWRPGQSLVKPLRPNDIASISTPSALCDEDEPSTSKAKRRNFHGNPSVRDWCLGWHCDVQHCRF